MAQPTNGPSPTSKTANKSYSGPLLWVDDRPGQLSPTKHRHVVHSHVQRSYLSWKRKDEQDREYNLKQPLEGQQFAYRQAPVESKLIVSVVKHRLGSVNLTSQGEKRASSRYRQHLREDHAFKGAQT